VCDAPKAPVTPFSKDADCLKARERANLPQHTFSMHVIKQKPDGD
jgi:hypothetical protein